MEQKQLSTEIFHSLHASYSNIGKIMTNVTGARHVAHEGKTMRIHEAVIVKSHGLILKWIIEKLVVMDYKAQDKV